MTEQAPPEAIEAALALVRDLARLDPAFHADHTLAGAACEARRIAALLPKPVDPAVLACREVMARMSENDESPVLAKYWRAGEYDDTPHMKGLIACYRAAAASTKGRG